MKATKYTVTIVIEVLSLDSVEGMLPLAAAQIGNEVTTGVLRHDDGDEIRWDYTSKAVEF